MAEADFMIDPDRVDDTVLAVLWLTLHDGHRVWKGIDFDALSRLHEKGLIEHPFGKAKSVELTDQGVKRSRELAQSFFGASAA